MGSSENFAKICPDIDCVSLPVKWALFGSCLVRSRVSDLAPRPSMIYFGRVEVLIVELEILLVDFSAALRFSTS